MTPLDRTEPAKTRLAQAENIAKPVAAILGSLTAVGAGALTLIGVFSDLYRFFLALTVISVISLVLTFGLFAFRFRISSFPNAGDVKVPRYGRKIVLAGLGVSLFCLTGLTFLLTIYNGALFDPVVSNPNDSAIDITGHDALRQRMSANAQLVVQAMEGQAIPPMLRDKIEVAMPAPADQNPENQRPRYTLSFDLTLKSRFDWVKVEKVSVVVLSFVRVPPNVRLAVVHGAELVRPGLEFTAALGPFDATALPTEVTADLVTTSHPITRRGSIVIDDHKPTSVFVDVFFETDGIYELVPEIVVNEGWRSRKIRPTKAIKVLGSKFRDPSFAPAAPRELPMPAPAMPAPKPGALD